MFAAVIYSCNLFSPVLAYLCYSKYNTYKSHSEIVSVYIADIDLEDVDLSGSMYVYNKKIYTNVELYPYRAAWISILFAPFMHTLALACGPSSWLFVTVGLWAKFFAGIELY